MSSISAELETESNKWARVAYRSGPLMETLGGFAIAIALVYGGYRVIETGATPGQFFSFLAAFMLAYEPAKRLARFNLDLNSGLVGVRILFDMIDRSPTEQPDENKPPLKLSAARVEFAKVQFAYHKGERVIRNLSLVAEPGRLTALVGPSGGGKSDHSQPDPAVLRNRRRCRLSSTGRISRKSPAAPCAARSPYVGQDVFLFRGSVRDNIAVGRPGATEADIVAAAKAAYAHDFIMAFPRGYATQVGEHGAQLAGGERQRIAVARALLEGCPPDPARRGDGLARIRNPSARCRAPSSTFAGDERPSSLPTGCTPWSMPIVSSSSRTAAWPNRVATTSCCANPGAMLRSTACSCAIRSRARAGPWHPWPERKEAQ